MAPPDMTFMETKTRIKNVTNMETRARIIFRELFLRCRIDGITTYRKKGIDINTELESWLKTHGGWCPEEKETWGDRTPLPEPLALDEGENVISNDPVRAMDEANQLMNHLCLVVGGEDFWLLEEVQD